MNKDFAVLALAMALLGVCVVGVRAQQYPMLDRVADRVVQKYQTSSCGQLREQRAERGQQPVRPEEQRVVQMLHEDPQMRREFLNRVAAPIANKLFECGMIP